MPVSCGVIDTLFKIDGVCGVFFGPDFVTVTRTDSSVNWEYVKPQVG